MSKIVARYADGTLVKGRTLDFAPGRRMFHVLTPDGGTSIVRSGDLKAVFWVKTYEGDPTHVDSYEFDHAVEPGQRPIRVRMADGEILVGGTMSYHEDGPGFFLSPADSGSNNTRCFLIAEEVEHVSLS